MEFVASETRVLLPSIILSEVRPWESVSLISTSVNEAWARTRGCRQSRCKNKVSHDDSKTLIDEFEHPCKKRPIMSEALMMERTLPKGTVEHNRKFKEEIFGLTKTERFGEDS